ncbi:transposase, partial [Streptomyces sp. NPDC046939]|uniref:transposase n=1 Tax=Streptomyces sp. NPDC046939 TaxID=3155376 RepID=UPI0033E4DF9A
WVVERTFAWLHGFRRLRVRWERRADIHEAFLLPLRHRCALCVQTVGFHRGINSPVTPGPTRGRHPGR